MLVKVKIELTESKQVETGQMNQEAINKAQIEKYTLDIENYKLQMADMAADRQKLINKYQSSSHSNHNKIADLEKQNENLES